MRRDKSQAEYRAEAIRKGQFTKQTRIPNGIKRELWSAWRALEGELEGVAAKIPDAIAAEAKSAKKLEKARQENDADSTELRALEAQVRRIQDAQAALGDRHAAYPPEPEDLAA